MRLFIHRPFGTLLDFGDYLAQGTHQVQYVFTKFASIMKTIEASNSGTLEADKPLNTRMIAKDRKSAAHAFALLLPILYTLPLFRAANVGRSVAGCCSVSNVKQL